MISRWARHSPIKSDMMRNSQNFWSLGLLVLSGVLFFVAENDGSLRGKNSGRSDQSSLAPINLDQRLNAHLKETSETLRLNDELRKIESRRPPNIGDLVIRPNGFGAKDNPMAVSPSQGLGLAEDTLEDSVYKRLHEHDPKSSSVLTPRDIVNYEVELKNQELNNRRQTEQARKDLVRQYVENARKRGYSVTINKDYVVEKVERLPNSIPDPLPVETKPRDPH